MRLNRFLAYETGLSRRAADKAIAAGRVTVNGHTAVVGQIIDEKARVALDGQAITPLVKTTTILLHKPVGFVCSRDGQGHRTIYDLLPSRLHHVKPAGRLDRDSSGLLLLTNDGQLAYRLTHPKFQKTKVYEVSLDRPLSLSDRQKITETGITLEDGISRLQLELLDDMGRHWQVSIQEGRNRQIRRTFEAAGYKVMTLHRISFGDYKLGTLGAGEYVAV